MSGFVWNDREKCYVTHLIWQIPTLPDFSAQRYARLLGDSVQQRVSQLIENTLRSLQSFHGAVTGNDRIAIALRLLRIPERPNILAFCIVRIASPTDGFTDTDSLREKYKAMLPNRQYYRYAYLDPASVYGQMALSVRGWARYGVELCKRVEILPSIASRFEELRGPFPDAWEVPAPPLQRNTNRLEEVCRALKEQQGTTMVDITLCPARLDKEDVELLNDHIQLLQQSVDALRQVSRSPSTRRIPGNDAHLDRALEVCKTIHRTLTQPTTLCFFYAFRIFTSGHDPRPLARIVSSAATKTDMAIVPLHSDKTLFDKSINAVERVDVDIVPEVNQGNDVWENVKINKDLLYRLHKMASLDELGGFWTLPIPLGSTFPGFTVDDGANFHIIDENEEESINLGIDESDRSITIRLRDITRHILVVGTPGSGKTTTLFHILDELKKRGVPWMVLEPAKTEYRTLKNLFPDVLVFTLGNELVSPFRFNPFDVPAGTPLEKHISRLYSCFLGAFNLFDPLPMFFDKAIRQIYAEKGWSTYDVGGEDTPQPPTIFDMYSVAENIVKEGKYTGEIGSNIKAAFVNRLEALQRGSIGRMMNVRQGLSLSDLMQKNVILELDALNADEKSLMAMFIFTHIYEYAKARHTSNNGLKHVLVIEEAHNLIGYSITGSSDRANPRLHAIELFTNMLAEMRALGEGIIIADQLPSALAPQAMKNTNIKILHQLVAGDDRKAIGLTMGMGDDEDKDPRLKEPVTFQPGEAFIFTGRRIAHVRMIPLSERVLKLKDQPPLDDDALRKGMLDYIEKHPEIFMPFKECSRFCSHCDPRVREWAEQSTPEYIERAWAYEKADNKDAEIIGKLTNISQDRRKEHITKVLEKNPEVREKLSEYFFTVCSEIVRSKKNSQLSLFCAYVHFMNTQNGRNCTNHEKLLKRIVEGV